MTFTELLLPWNWKVSEYVPLAALVVVAVLLQGLAPAFFEHVIVAPAITAFVTELAHRAVDLDAAVCKCIQRRDAAPRAAT